MESPGFIRAYNRDSAWETGGVYDDDGVGDVVNSNTAVADIERMTEAIQNYRDFI